MNILNLIGSLVSKKKKLDIKSLPSQALFYKEDFELMIRKATIEEIVDYEYEYDSQNLALIIYKIKKIVKACTYLPKTYTFDDIKALDVIYIFLEIVKFTNNKEIRISYFNEQLGKKDGVEFASENFNYFKISDNLMNNYNNDDKEFVIDNYKFSLPSIGVEDSLTEYLIKNSDRLSKDYAYDFIYFLGSKRRLSFSELDNLITIFNEDLDKNEQAKVRKIVTSFSPIFKYTLKKDNKVIDLNSKLNLEKIWNH